MTDAFLPCLIWPTGRVPQWRDAGSAGSSQRNDSHRSPTRLGYFQHYSDLGFISCELLSSGFTLRQKACARPVEVHCFCGWVCCLLLCSTLKCLPAVCLFAEAAGCDRACRGGDAAQKRCARPAHSLAGCVDLHASRANGRRSRSSEGVESANAGREQRGPKRAPGLENTASSRGAGLLGSEEPEPAGGDEGCTQGHAVARVTGVVGSLHRCSHWTGARGRRWSLAAQAEPLGGSVVFSVRQAENCTVRQISESLGSPVPATWHFWAPEIIGYGLLEA